MIKREVSGVSFQLAMKKNAGWKHTLQIVVFLTVVVCGGTSRADELPKICNAFIKTHCIRCHSQVDPVGEINLSSMSLALENTTQFAKYVKIFDRVSTGEMPPPDEPCPEADAVTEFTSSLRSTLLQAEQTFVLRQGRATRRRLNRHEYENAVRDLRDAPWLQIKDLLPEDGLAFGFNKVGEGLEMSYDHGQVDER